MVFLSVFSPFRTIFAGVGFAGVVLALSAPVTVEAKAQEAEQPETASPREVLDFGGMRPDDLLVAFREDPYRWANESCTFGVPILVAMQTAMPERTVLVTLTF